MSDSQAIGDELSRRPDALLHVVQEFLVLLHSTVNCLTLSMGHVQSTTKVYGPQDLRKRSISQQPVTVVGQTEHPNVVHIYS